jgi:hypothetical protein
MRIDKTSAYENVKFISSPSAPQGTLPHLWPRVTCLILVARVAHRLLWCTSRAKFVTLCAEHRRFLQTRLTPMGDWPCAVLFTIVTHEVGTARALIHVVIRVPTS